MRLHRRRRALQTWRLVSGSARVCEQAAGQREMISHECGTLAFSMTRRSGGAGGDGHTFSVWVKHHSLF